MDYTGAIGAAHGFMGQMLPGSTSGQYAYSGLFNVASSGVLVHVIEVCVYDIGSGDLSFGPCGDLDTDQDFIEMLRGHGTKTAHQRKALNASATYQSYSAIITGAPVAAMPLYFVRPDAPIILPEGVGVAVRANTVNVAFAGWVKWVEVPG